MILKHDTFFITNTFTVFSSKLLFSYNCRQAKTRQLFILPRFSFLCYCAKKKKKNKVSFTNLNIVLKKRSILKFGNSFSSKTPVKTLSFLQNKEDCQLPLSCPLYIFVFRKYYPPLFLSHQVLFAQRSNTFLWLVGQPGSIQPPLSTPPISQILGTDTCWENQSISGRMQEERRGQINVQILIRAAMRADYTPEFILSLPRKD